MAIYTVGHGDQSSDSLFDLLQSHRIDSLIDVRSTPFSGRHPQFNQAALRGAALSRHIEYRWEYDLGGKPKERSLWLEAGVPNYLAMAETDGFKKALGTLITEAETKRVAIMCSEGRPEACHRTLLLGTELIRRGVGVQHLLRDGRVLDEVAAGPRLI